MASLPHQPVYGRPTDIPAQMQHPEYPYFDLPLSAPMAGPSGSYVSPPLTNGQQPRLDKSSFTPMQPPNGFPISPNHHLELNPNQWWNTSDGSTPPSVHGSQTTPPPGPDGAQSRPAHPAAGEMYTPVYPGSQLVTPSTQQFNAGPHGYPTQSVHYQRPPLATSLSYPGPLFPGGGHLPMGIADPNGDVAGLGFGQTPGPAQNYQFGMAPSAIPNVYVDGTPHHQMPYGSGPNGLMANEEWGGEWEDDEHPGEWYNGNMEIKHRRRTSPEQLKVLEHWFDINSKPDNALREWLAGELGMTKRNVQVWFQNRRAKIKGQLLRDKAAQDKTAKDQNGQKTPEGQIIPSRPAPVAQLPHPFPRELRERAEQGLHGHPLPGPVAPPVSDRNLNLAIPMGLPNGGRRVSLASGEADRIQMWAAKRNGAGPSMGGSGPRSPVIGQASAARRGSIPYPTPLSISTMDMSGRPGPNSGSSSPKFSPSVRPAPSALHLAAIRNNTRRASMPGPPQLLSSGPFTPPRIVSYPINSSLNNGPSRELGSIKDNEGENAHSAPDPSPPFMFSESDFSTTFITPQSSTYFPSGSYGSLSNSDMAGPDDSAKLAEQQNINGPYPNPAFSFGNNAVFAMPSDAQQMDESRRAQAIYESIQQRGRIGSLASIGTNDSDATAGTAGTGGTGGTGDELDFGDFDPNRRASAPSALLDLGLMGISSYNGGNGQGHGPSPLGASGFTPVDPSHQQPYHFGNQYTQNSLTIPTASDYHTPSSGGSVITSPVDMVMSASMSAPSLSATNSLNSHSPHTPNGNSPPNPGNTQHVHPAQNQYRSLSASATDYRTGNEDFWGFTTDVADTSFSLPTMTVSAPSSAYPGSGGEGHQQQGLMAPANIPARPSSQGNAGSRRSSSAGVVNGPSI